MTADNPFQPPRAVVDDAAIDSPRSRLPVAALAILGGLLLLWLLRWMPLCWTLVQEGAMNPVGPLLATIGSVCLYVGLLLAIPAGVRGKNFFLAAMVLLASGLAMLGVQVPFFALFAIAPFMLALVVATGGYLLVRTRTRRRPVSA